MITKIKEALSKNDTTTICVKNSNWKNHKIDGYKNELTICTAFGTDDFNEIKQKTIQYYLDNQEKYYTLFITEISKICTEIDYENFDFVNDDLDEVEDNYNYDIDVFDVDLPKKITTDWLKKHVKLIAINILEQHNKFSSLEFDFAVSWDLENGLKALVWKDKILDFDEGGTVWAAIETYLD